MITRILLLSLLPLPIILLALTLLLSACSRSTSSPTEATATITPLSRSAGLHLTLTAHNLSEDANPVSTQDDELILLIYTQGPADQLPTLVFQEYFILDSAQRVKEIMLADSVLQQQEIALVLIEMDSDMSIQQVEPIVRLNLETILNLDQATQTEELRELLGDDDLLGAKKFKSEELQSQGQKIEFKGRRLFDSFHYVVAFGK